MEKVIVKFAKVDERAVMPAYSTPGAAGADIYALTETLIEPMAVRQVRTGLRIEVPDGYEAQVRSRSGLSSQGIVVANSPGTIDSDYRGELIVLIQNLSDGPYYVQPGQRVAQMVIAPTTKVAFDMVEESQLSETERGTNGLGSTGT